VSAAQDWDTIAERLKQQLPWSLFTVLDVDWADGLVRRSFSSDEAHYPSGGVKHLMKSPWADQVIFGQEPFISKDAEDFRKAFADHALLEQLGLRFALNVPVLVGSRTAYTVNLLSNVGPFSKASVNLVRKQIAMKTAA